MFEIQDVKPDSGMRIAIVASRFNQFIVDQLLEGARDAMARHQVDQDGCALVWVPGAFELPVMAAQLASSGKYDAVVTLGAVIRGGTPHFDYVAGECAAGITRVALDTGETVTFGDLTTDKIEQPLESAGTGEGNKAFDLTVVELEMAQTMRRVSRHLSGETG